jgi:hypothetical protein
MSGSVRYEGCVEPPAGLPAGGFVLQSRDPCRTGRLVTQEHIDELSLDAYVRFGRGTPIERFGMHKFVAEQGSCRTPARESLGRL